MMSVFLAYSLVFVLLLAYVALLAVRLGRLEEEAKRLRDGGTGS